MGPNRFKKILAHIQRSDISQNRNGSKSIKNVTADYESLSLILTCGGQMKRFC